MASLISIFSECSGTFLYSARIYQSPVWPYNWLFEWQGGARDNIVYSGNLKSKTVRFSAEIIYSGSQPGSAGLSGSLFNPDASHSVLFDIFAGVPCSPGTAYALEMPFEDFYQFAAASMGATVSEESTIEVKIINIEITVAESSGSGSRLYKLDAFDEVTVPVPSPPPQINRPPPAPSGSNYVINFGIFSTGSTAIGSSPRGGSSSNTNTNNRPNRNGPNNRDLDPINNQRDREELLRKLHEHNASGIQY